MLDGGGVGVVVRVIDHDDAAVGLDYLIYNAGQGGYKVKVKFALKALLNDLHVQHAEEAAAEAEAKRHGALRLEGQGGVVELKLFECVAQVGVFAAVLGVYTAVDHGSGGAVAG